MEIQYGLITNAGDSEGVSEIFFKNLSLQLIHKRTKMTLLCLCVLKSVNFFPLIKIPQGEISRHKIELLFGPFGLRGEEVVSGVYVFPT